MFSRFLITSRKRPELDPEHCLGNFEFSVVPKVLFSFDGEPLPYTDKAKLLHHIEELGKLQQQHQMEISDVNDGKVLVIITIIIISCH